MHSNVTFKRFNRVIGDIKPTHSDDRVDCFGANEIKKLLLTYLFPDAKIQYFKAEYKLFSDIFIIRSN